MTADKDSSTISCSGLAGLIDQVARGVYCLAWAGDLNPAQWAALRYFRKAQPTRRTIGAFAEFQGVGQASASRTIASLMDKGFLRRGTDPMDRRRAVVELTDKGAHVISDDPLLALVRALERRPETEREVAANLLSEVLVELLDLRRGTQATGTDHG
ncbi:MAG TPA: MarR family transcriptional regulator [Azospirillaceae bacterium]|nr:MarR family transcriptional regulator [Azospirillaceae bacterium]